MRLVMFGVVAFAANAMSPLFRYPQVGSAVLFPPYAVLTAALVVSRRRHWIWLVLLDATAHFVTHYPQWPLSWVLLASLANVARGCRCRAAPEVTGRRSATARERPCVHSVLVHGALIAPAVGAAIGAANVMLHGAASTYGSRGARGSCRTRSPD